MKRVISISIDPDVYEELSNIEGPYVINKSALINKLLKEWIKENAEPKP